MADCRHCGGTGRCQNNFHSGGGLFGGRDEAGQNHPGLLDSMFGSCPNCGDGNAEWRPECRHCDGTGKDGKEWSPFGPQKKIYLGGDSVKERQHRERTQSGGSGGGSSFGGGGTSLTDNATLVGGGIGALIGLLNAIESASSVGGYLFSIIVGFFGGAILTSLMMTLLPWAILAGILMLLIKACGG